MARYDSLLAAVLCAALVASTANTASAAAPPGTREPPRDARALDLFEQSARAYREGRFQDAVDKLLEARRLKPEPVLLYDLGRAYEALGRPADAADAYAKYLEEEPKAADRPAIEGRIATLRAQAAELAKAREAPQPAPATTIEPSPTPPPAAPARSDPFAAAPWVVTAVGAAGLGTGIVLGVVAKNRHADAVADPVQRSAVETQSSAESFAQASTITLIAGAVVLAMGLAWLGLRTVQPRATSRAFVLGGTF